MVAHRETGIPGHRFGRPRFGWRFGYALICIEKTYGDAPDRTERVRQHVRRGDPDRQKTVTNQRTSAPDSWIMSPLL